MNRESKVNGIAVVGIACKYPDADNHNQFWENILSGRRAFRKIPEERLGKSYISPDSADPDLSYNQYAAVLRNYEFDREKFSVSGKSFRSADMAHWLALDVAFDVLENAGFLNGSGINKEATGVYIGNSLTGEFSRAGLMRLRWPYVARTLLSLLKEKGWENEEIEAFLNNYEKTYKSPFPKIGVDSLAGGLANTIAGRICNYFDFKGGGYTVDGACSSSLLAVNNACSALNNYDVDYAIAGGVDLSLDPFEMVGFSRIGAMAKNYMRVYDQRSEGFWPGEGCGMILLMREVEAIELKLNIYAIIKGWGISSDGQGGLTRPEKHGHMLAMKRAYAKAGYNFSELGYFEGHGTGTVVGDAVELEAISLMRTEEPTHLGPLQIGSVKANIGHTKAAAGMAGLIKSVLSVHHQVIPGAVEADKPAKIFSEISSGIELPKQSKTWTQGEIPRAGMSALGFGGINAHVTLEGVKPVQKTKLTSKESKLAASWQDIELFIFSGKNARQLQQKLASVLKYSEKISLSEMGDLAATLAAELCDGKFRVAVVAKMPRDFTRALIEVCKIIESGKTNHTDIKSGIFISDGSVKLNIGLLFPGQASPVRTQGGIMSRRFPELKFEYGFPDKEEDLKSTAVSQPSIVSSSIYGMRMLNYFGISANSALGHSLGEMSALCWSGVFDEDTLVRLAKERGRIMVEYGEADAGMLSIAVGSESALRLIENYDVEISGINTSNQTIVSGYIKDLERLKGKLEQEGIASVLLKVSHAFHSKLMKHALPPFGALLNELELKSPAKDIYSTITGGKLAGEDIKSLLLRQLEEPVRFLEAFQKMEADVFIEVGPGKVLTNLAGSLTDVPVLALDVFGESLSGLLHTLGFLIANSHDVDIIKLFEDRFNRPFDLDWQATFLQNPCEAEISEFSDEDALLLAGVISNNGNGVAEQSGISIPDESTDVLTTLRNLIATNLELPLTSIQPDQKMLDDLHLNSITVGQIIAQAAAHMKLPMPASPTEYANASVLEIANVLERIKEEGGINGFSAEEFPNGISHWVRPFKMEKVKRSLNRKNDDAVFIPGKWELICDEQNSRFDLAKSLAGQLSKDGVLCCLSESTSEQDLDLLIALAQALNKNSDLKQVVVVQECPRASGFVKSLSLEYPEASFLVVNGQVHEGLGEKVNHEITRPIRFSEISLSEDGKRVEYQLVEEKTNNQIDQYPIDDSDIILVTGGGKGITAEVALAIGLETGSKLILLGRSDPNSDEVLAKNLERFRQKGLSFRYLSTDVNDDDRVENTIAKIQEEEGRITGIIHGAGINNPLPSSELTKEIILKTLKPKVGGVSKILSMLDPTGINLFWTFSSIIARSGMKGNADYALANEWLSKFTIEFAEAHPECHTLALEWSVWAGTGMGDKLGVLDQLVRQGIQPISIDEGVEITKRLLKQKVFPALVLSGRFGDLPTIQVEKPDLPLSRFFEEIKVYYPGIELIVAADLSHDTDRYLKDHTFEGQAIMPGVIGLEAMAQTAIALTEKEQKFSFSDVEFLRPIVVPAEGKSKIRILSQIDNNNSISLSIRSEQSGFHTDHIKAKIVFGDNEKPIVLPPDYTNGKKIDVHPQTDLYSNLLFHKGMFQLVASYNQLCWNKIQAEISKPNPVKLFSKFFPQIMVLSHPASRDACLHAVQACVPSSTLLPTKVKNIHIEHPGEMIRSVRAVELNRDGGKYTYNLWMLNAKGDVVEFWEGLEFHSVASASERVLNPYLALLELERAISENGYNHSINLSGVIEKNKIEINKRPDGKPELDHGKSISISHEDDFTLVVSGHGKMGCDLEKVNPDIKEWDLMLGADNFGLAKWLTDEFDEPLSVSATRVWGVMESLRKAGSNLAASITYYDVLDKGIVRFLYGNCLIYSYQFLANDDAERLVYSVLTETEKHEELHL